MYPYLNNLIGLSPWGCVEQLLKMNEAAGEKN